MAKRFRKQNRIYLILWIMLHLIIFSSLSWAGCDPSTKKNNSETYEENKINLNKSSVLYENNPFSEVLSKQAKEKPTTSDSSKNGTKSDLKANSSKENDIAPKKVDDKNYSFSAISNAETQAWKNNYSDTQQNQDIPDFSIISSKATRSIAISHLIPQNESISKLAEGIPQPGEKIDKKNINDFTKFFPSNFIPAFKNGWNLISPISAITKKTIPNSFCTPFLEASKRNKGKYTVNKEGYINEDLTKIVGLPFPDLDPKDPQFTIKLMWNYEFKYDFDEMHFEMITFAKHGGKPFIAIELAEGDSIRFQNRMFVSPKPYYENPHNIRKANLMKNTWPVNRRRGGFLTYRYTDQEKSDATYYYVPGARLLVKGSSDERSSPIAGSTLTIDDFNVFDGRTAEFNYQLVKAQSLLVCGSTNMDYLKDLGDIRESNHLIFPKDMEIREVYVLDIIPKEKKYFQSRKRIYIDRENYNIYYGEIWDRAKKLWKIIYASYEATHLPNGETNPNIFGILGIDIQLGFATASNFFNQCNDQHLTANHFEVSNFQKMATR